MLESLGEGLVLMNLKRTGRSAWAAVIAPLVACGFIAATVAGDGPVLADTSDDMHIGEKGIELITQFEGVKLDGYLLGDGVCTIGYGHTRAETAGCKDWHITQDQAEEFLATDADKYGAMVNDYFDRDFNQNQFDALVSFTYNVGAAYKKYDWPTDPSDDFITGAMIKYTNPPKFKAGLLKRRKAEIALYETPVTGQEQTETADDLPVMETMIDEEQPLPPQLSPTPPATTIPPEDPNHGTESAPEVAPQSADLPQAETTPTETTATTTTGELAFQGGAGAR